MSSLEDEHREPEEPTRRYIVVDSERAEADRQAAFLRFASRDPRYAGLWLEGLLEATSNLANFPGPLAHSIDSEASAVFGREVRRLLYYGSDKQRSRTVYRVLYCVIAPQTAGEDAIIRTLRVLHGAQLLTRAENDDEDDT